MNEKTLRQYWIETQRLRHGDLLPDASSSPYGEVQLATPNPHDLPAAPDPYAPNAPDEGYRSIYDPYPGLVDVIDYERGLQPGQREAELGRVLRVVPEGVREKVEARRRKEAERLRAFRAGRAKKAEEEKKK